VRDEPKPVRGAVARLAREWAIGGDPPLLVGDRARDPGRVVVLHERTQRRDEAARAAARHAPALAVHVEADGGAVRDHDELSA
jgi:hypothetical protein